MKRPSRFLLVLPLIASIVSACSFDADIAKESASPGSNPLDCASGERFFNGSCRFECASSATCTGDSRCVQIEPGASVCLTAQHCSFLASDTQCVGTGFSSSYSSYGGYGEGAPSDPYDANPYDVTPYTDPYFNTDYPYTSLKGCQGNAHFVKIDATGDIACGQVHAVDRCRREGNRCALVPGTTKDLVAP